MAQLSTINDLRNKIDEIGLFSLRITVIEKANEKLGLEAGVGLTLLLGGRFIRWGAFTGCLLMGGIMFGTGMLEKWELLPSQLIHLGLFYAVLMNPHTPDNKNAG